MADVRLPNLISDNMVLQRDMAAPVWGWAEAGEQVTVSMNGKSAKATAGADGKWIAKIGPLDAGGPFEMTVKGKNTITLKNVMVGEVWICCGQSNLTYTVGQNVAAKDVAAGAEYPNIRMLSVSADVSSTPVEDVAGAKWTECSPTTVGGFSAVGYFFGRDVFKGLNVPVGLIQTGISDTRVEFYMSPAALKSDPDFEFVYELWRRWKKDLNLDEDFPGIEENLREVYLQQGPLKRAHAKAVEEAKKEGKEPPAEPKLLPWRIVKNFPSGQYFAMVRPLMPYGIRGVMWYQGEGNGTTAHLYRKTFPAMIRSWREEWGQGEFPFLFVQLPRIYPTRPCWAEMRDAYLQTLRTVPHTGMAVTHDLTTTGDVVHPPDKEPVGARLALAALGQVYGKDVAYSGPLFKAAVREEAGFRVTFEHAEGLTLRGEKLQGFTVAGEDGYFHEADAVIDGAMVVVAAKKVRNPVSVRYAWANNPDGNLFNGAGLPASPFRSDNLPDLTERDVTDYGRKPEQVEYIVDYYIARGMLRDADDFIVDWGGDPVLRARLAIRVSDAYVKANRPAEAQRLTALLFYGAGKIEDAAARANVLSLLKGEKQPAP